MNKSTPASDCTQISGYHLVIAKIANIPVEFFLWLALAILYFTFSGFIFFDLIGIRRPFQIASLAIIASLGIIYFYYNIRSVRIHLVSVLFLSYVIVTSLHVFFRHNDSLFALNGVIVLFTSILLAIRPSGHHHRFEQFMISGSIIFATAGIIQFFILLFHPEWFKYIEMPNDVLYLSTGSNIKHPITWLGLTAGADHKYEIMGFHIARMRSFMFEPSLVIVYFLLPAGYLLLCRKSLQLFAYLLLGFSFLTFSGAAILSIGVGFITLFLHRYLRIKFLFILFPLATTALFSFASDIETMTMIAEVLKVPGDMLYEYTGSKLLIKPISIAARLEMFRQATSTIIAEPFGSPVRTDLAAGTFWLSYLNGTPVAFVMNLTMMIWIYHRLGKISTILYQATRTPWANLLGVAVIYGVTFCLFTFTCYGFISAFGLIWIYLLLRKLYSFNLSSKNNNQTDSAVHHTY